ncbi:hypothetical protein FSP39_002905 [Pinctada imbricata]|uniref:CUB domain-containing protein n=1 Tax=Pinctada imbricata TaxID=66713 RepID=A0AA89BWQ4_PINIB|nr:hypothetical protein FSP39_002905 [Pinctada imbricata]
MEEGCNSLINLGTTNDEAIQLKLTRNSIYSRNIDCTVAIQPPPGKNLVVKFNNMDIQQLQTGQCADILLAIDGIDRTSARYLAGAPQQICGRNLIGSSFVTSQGYLILRFRSGVTNQASRGFDATIAAFKQGPCSSNEYSCNNGRCIHGDLRCSGYDLCGDGTNPCLLTGEAITGLAVGGSILVIIIIALIVFCMCRHRRKTNFSEKAHEQRRADYEPTVVRGESIKINSMNGVRGVVY